MYISRNTNYIQLLLSQDKRTFRTSELAVLWGVQNQNTLLVTTSRLVKRGVLHRLARGLYSTVPSVKLDIFEYGCAVSGSLSYVSAETILSNIGAINQLPTKITLFGKKTKEFSLGDHDFYCRYLRSDYLINRSGIVDNSRYSVASPGRALSDMRHILPGKYIDNPELAKVVEGEDIYVST